MDDITAAKKYTQIIDALEILLKDRQLSSISVSDIAQCAGIGKGSIYYYFKSKDEIFEALIERKYKKSIDTAKNLVKQTDIPPFTRMAMIFQACRNTSTEFMGNSSDADLTNKYEIAYLTQRYMQYLIAELKPELADIIAQGIKAGEIRFEYPEQLAEIVLIILTIKMNPQFSGEEPAEVEKTMLALISLLEKGTDNPAGSMNFLLAN